MRDPVPFAALLAGFLSAGCAPPDEAEDPWSGCDGIAGRATLTASVLFVADDVGTPLIYASSSRGGGWARLGGDLSTLSPVGAAPMTYLRTDSLLAVRADPAGRLTLVTEGGLRVVEHGFEDPENIAWWFDDDGVHDALQATNAWVVDGELYVAYTERIGEDDWTGSFGVVDDDGRITPLVANVGTELDADDRNGVRLVGGWDPLDEVFVLVPTDASDTVWRISRGGDAETTPLSDSVGPLVRWVPLGDGRWTGANGNWLVVFDPDVPDSLVQIDRTALPAPLAAGDVYRLPDGRVVVMDHIQGGIQVREWDGDDVEAGVTHTFPFSVYFCDPWANMPPLIEA